MGFQNDRKPAKDKIWAMQRWWVFKMTESQRRTEFVLCSRYDCCSGSHRIPSGLLSWFPVFSGASWLPVLRVLLWVLLRIWRFLEFIVNSALQQPVRLRVFFFREHWVHLCALHSVHNSLYLHLAKRASFTCKTDSFLWGHGPDTLACKARPSFDRCGTSLSVSLCHCHCSSSIW